MREFMEMIALESGQISKESDLPDYGGVSGVLVDAVQEEPSLVGHFDRIEDSKDLGTQLDELAEHADKVARAEENGDRSAEAVYISTESLHREFKTIMRSVDLTFNASSFEAANSNAERLVGIARDARRVSKLSKELGNELTDYTQEGAIWKFLRRDESKLEKAHNLLDAAGKRYQRDINALKEKPVAIRNAGFARFMTRRNKQVNDLVAAIGSESKWLSGAHDQIESSVKVLADYSNKLRSGQVLSALNSLTNARPFTAVSSLATEEGYLMGNNTIESDEAYEGPFPHLVVPRYTRSSQIRIQGKSIAWAVAGAASNAFTTFSILRLVAVGGILLGGPVAIAASALTSARTAIVAGNAAVGAYQAYNETQDESRTGSQATATDLKSVIDSVLSYSRFTNYTLDADLIAGNLKAAGNNTEGLTDEQKVQLKGVVEALQLSLDRLVRLAGIVYEQSYFTTTMSGALIDAVVNRVRF
jgi:hypothetical protein